MSERRTKLKERRKEKQIDRTSKTTIKKAKSENVM